MSQKKKSHRTKNKVTRVKHYPPTKVRNPNFEIRRTLIVEGEGGVTVLRGVSWLVTEDTELLIGMVVANVALKFGAVVLKVTYFSAISTNYCTSPDTGGGRVSRSSTMIAIVGVRHRSGSMKSCDVLYTELPVEGSWSTLIGRSRVPWFSWKGEERGGDGVRMSP